MADGMKGNIVSEVFGIRPDFEKSQIRDRVLELERRVAWLASELLDDGNGFPKSGRYSKEMLDSLDDEMHVLELLANVMRRRQKIVE